MSIANLLVPNCSYNLFAKSLTLCPGGSSVLPNNSINEVLPFTLIYQNDALSGGGPFTSHPLMNWALFSSNYNGRLIYTVLGTINVMLPTNIITEPVSIETLTIEFELSALTTAFDIGVGTDYTVYYANGELSCSGLNNSGRPGNLDLISDGQLQSDDNTIKFTFNDNNSNIFFANTDEGLPLQLSLGVVFNQNSAGIFPKLSMVSVAHSGAYPGPYPVTISITAGSPDFALVTSITLDNFPTTGLVVTPTTITFDAPANPPPGGNLTYGIYAHDANNYYTEVLGWFTYPTS